MDVHAQPVAGAVHVEPLVLLLLDDALDPALERTEVHQPLDQHLHRRRVHVVERPPGRHRVDGSLLRREHHRVDVALRAGEPAVDGEGAGDVGGVVLELGTRVDEQQVASPQPIGVLGVVQRARVRSAGHDGRIRRGAASRPGELVEQLRLDLVLGHSGTAHAHGALVGGGAHRGRPRHRVHLCRALEQPHLVDKVIQHDELAESAARPRAAAHLRDPRQHALVELREVAHRVVDPRLVLEQPRQDVVHVADGKRVVGAVALARPFESEPGSVPLLRGGVALAAEHHELALLAPGREHRHRLGFGESGEVVEVAVGTERELDITVARPHRRGRHDRDAPLPHHVHQSLPAFRELASMHGE